MTSTINVRTVVVRLLLTGLIATASLPVALGDDDEAWGSIEVVGRSVAPGTSSKFPFMPDRPFEASFLNTPVFVARGRSPGPTLCLTAGVHGDEINGVEVARRAFAGVDPRELRGTLIVLMAINAEGVRTGSRYLSDRRDLNRAFPGKAGGSIASLIANAIFSEVLVHCDALVDLHTGSNQRANLPQIRADLTDPAIRDLAIHFGVGIVVAGAGPSGSLRREAAKAGITAIIYEAGEPLRFQEEEIARGADGVESVMAHLDMIDAPEMEIPESRIYERTRWIRAAPNHAGFFFPSVAMGDDVDAGDLLGRIVDPLTDEIFEVTSTIDGEVIGMAVPQPVLSGYALFHVAWRD